jgi:hypothetical protein
VNEPGAGVELLKLDKYTDDKTDGRALGQSSPMGYVTNSKENARGGKNVAAIGSHEPRHRETSHPAAQSKRNGDGDQHDMDGTNAEPWSKNRTGVGHLFVVVRRVHDTPTLPAARLFAVERGDGTTEDLAGL